MIVLGRSDALTPTNPKLRFLHQHRGVVQALDALEFQVFSPAGAQVFPALPGTWSAVDVDGAGKLGVGDYAGSWTVPADAPTGEWKLRWRWRRLPADPWKSVDVPFDVLAVAPPPSLGPFYALPSSLRAEGVPAAGFSGVPDARLLVALALASKYAERVTRRWFEPRYLTLDLDGRGGQAMLLQDPIVGIERLTYLATPFMLADYTQDGSYYRVYNRHLGGLLNPDDRDAPRVELYGVLEVIFQNTVTRPFDQAARFARGRQNVGIVGWFGYTDPDGGPFGQVPMLLQHAVRLLTLRNLPKLTAATARSAARDGWRITQESTREQSVTYGTFGNAASVVGGFTGDPEIDQLLVSFMAPVRLGSA